MFRTGILAAAAFFMIGTAAGTPQSQQPAGNSPAADGLPVGSAIRATLSSSLDSKKLKPGDKVSAETSAATKFADKIILPVGAKLVGHVTHAAARSKGDSISSVGIVFDRAILKHNQEIPLNVSVLALAAAQQNASLAAPSTDLGPTAGMGPVAQGSAMPNRPGATGTIPPPSASTPGNASNPAGNTDSNHPISGRGAEAGLDSAGLLTPESRGVFGLQGLTLASAAGGAEPDTTITSTGKEVRLESGTQLLLITQAPAQSSH